MHLSTLAVLSGTALTAQAALGNSPSCGSSCNLYTQVWGEEFDNPIDDSVWWYRTDTKGNSTQLASNVAVSDGIMSIAVKKQDYTNSKGVTKHYTAGGIISHDNFHYGYYEARMKMTPAAGWHVSFWQMAGNGTGTGQTADPTMCFSEFDSFEVETANPTQIRNNIFEWLVGTPLNSVWQGSGWKTMGSPAYNWGSNYATFGTLWTETTVSFFVNGTQLSTYSYPANTKPHDYLNMWVTAMQLTGNPDDTALPSSVLTDYVRFYQRDYYLTATSLCRSLSQGSVPCPSTVGYKETSGSWAESALQGYTLQLKSRYSCSANPVASWTQTIGATGTYDIYTYVVAQSGSDPSVTFSVSNDGVAVGTTTTVNQSTATTGWVKLATGVKATSGKDVVVTVQGSATGCTRSDTVKMVRTA